jgi:hypothetical protein
MKLHSALKDPAMKYPQAANRLLDLGMVMTILGGISVCAVVLGMTSISWVSLCVFVGGVVILIVAKLVAGLKNFNVQDDRQRLKLVK